VICRETTGGVQKQPRICRFGNRGNNANSSGFIDLQIYEFSIFKHILAAFRSGEQLLCFHGAFCSRIDKIKPPFSTDIAERSGCLTNADIQAVASDYRPKCFSLDLPLPLKRPAIPADHQRSR
jgi:hypothetical protein